MSPLGFAYFTNLPVGGVYFAEAGNRRVQLPSAHASMLGSFILVIDTSPEGPKVEDKDNYESK